MGRGCVAQTKVMAVLMQLETGSCVMQVTE